MKKKANQKRLSDVETKCETLDTKIDSKSNEILETIDNKFTEFTTAFAQRLGCVEESVSHYPEYRQQSLQMQAQLKAADVGILEVCNAIKDDVAANRQLLDERLKSLERREKNALREKILDLYRKFTDDVLNPMSAWTDMEHHSFFELVKDYESLGGNDYVHKVILPAMNQLDIISMDDLEAVKELYDSRNSKHFKKPVKKNQDIK